jgi:large subunit ribosomal protein L17
MRHQSKGRKFGRKSPQRNALKRDVVNALFRHGRIVTTTPRAKEFRPYAERMITVAKRAAAAKASGKKEDVVVHLNAYRKLVSELHDETSVAHLISEIAPSFADRQGGYTRVVKLPKGRKGDAAPTSIFELVNYEPPAEAAEEAAATKKSAGETAAAK